MNAPTYDYEKQCWVDSPALEREQLEAELALLSGTCGLDYASCINIDRDESIVQICALLKGLST